MATREASRESGWEQEWRSNVTEQLKQATEFNNRTAVLLERLTGQVEQHDRELDELREQRSRDSERQSERTYARVEKVSENWRAYLSLAISIGVALIYLANLMSEHWK